MKKRRNKLILLLLAVFLTGLLMFARAEGESEPSETEPAGEPTQESTEPAAEPSGEESTEDIGETTAEESTSAEEPGSSETGAESTEATEDSTVQSEESTEQPTESSSDDGPDTPSETAGGAPDAVFIATGYDCGYLTGVGLSGEYSLDGVNYFPTEDGEAILTGIAPGIIYVRDPELPEIQEIRIRRRAIPEIQVYDTPCPSWSGCVTGVTAEMEYSFNGTDWIDMSANTNKLSYEYFDEETGSFCHLNPRTTYLIRAKAKGDMLTSDPAKAWVNVLSGEHSYVYMNGYRICLYCGGMEELPTDSDPEGSEESSSGEAASTEMSGELPLSSADAAESSPEESKPTAASEEPSVPEERTSTENEDPTQPDRSELDREKAELLKWGAVFGFTFLLMILALILFLKKRKAAGEEDEAETSGNGEAPAAEEQE